LGFPFFSGLVSTIVMPLRADLAGAGAGALEDLASLTGFAGAFAAGLAAGLAAGFVGLGAGFFAAGFTGFAAALDLGFAVFFDTGILRPEMVASRDRARRQKTAKARLTGREG
jgi:hypothetical protein